MGVKIKSRAIEEIVVECKTTPDDDRMVITKNGYTSEFELEFNGNSQCILLTKEDAKQLGQALIDFAEQDDE